eukprot:scaffold26966_cov31-Tisochrysis_lutea.AAC.1
MQASSAVVRGLSRYRRALGTLRPEGQPRHSSTAQNVFLWPIANKNKRKWVRVIPFLVRWASRLSLPFSSR